MYEKRPVYTYEKRSIHVKRLIVLRSFSKTIYIYIHVYIYIYICIYIYMYVCQDT